MPAEDDGEVFELVDAQDRVVGHALRSTCHREGLLHRAAYCWLFDCQGRLLIQRRSPRKKIGPGQWDLSVAEHLQPGETYAQAVQRGLREELGVSVGLDALAGPLAPAHRRELHWGQFHDVEMVQSYRLGDWRGEQQPIRIDPEEVAEYRFVELAELRSAVAARPHDYTQWLREEGASLGWFGGGGEEGSGAAAAKAASRHGGEREQRQGMTPPHQQAALRDRYDMLPF
eukprot:scaffold2.g7425.t1